MNETSFIHNSSFCDKNLKIGRNTKIWHFCHISENVSIGNNCTLGQNVYLGKNVFLGNNIKIQNNVSIYESVLIEDDVFCGPSVVFTNVKNPRAFISRKDEFLETKIKKGASLGANSTIVCGVTIGEYAMIGAGSVITKTVKPHALMIGVPALRKGWVSLAGEVLDEKLVCPKDGSKYKISNQQLVLI